MTAPTDRFQPPDDPPGESWEERDEREAAKADDWYDARADREE